MAGGNPIGGSGEVVNQIRMQGKDHPIRVAGLIAQLRSRGLMKNARSLLRTIGRSHPAPEEAETLALGLIADSHASLDIDDDCAWCLADLAARAPLSEAAVEAIHGRLADASGHTTPPAEPVESGRQRWSPNSQNDDSKKPERDLAVFGGLRGSGVSSAGAFPWLHALGVHYLRVEGPTAEAWCRAVRAGLRVDPRPGTWATVLDDFRRAWPALAGPEGLTLVEEIQAKATPADNLSNSLSRVFLYHQGLDIEPVRRWVDILLEQGRHAVAGEIAVVLATNDPPEAWAVAALDDWRAAQHAPDSATGVLAAVGELISRTSRRGALSTIASSWLAVAHVRDLALLFKASYYREIWRGDRASCRILRSLIPRVPEMSDEEIRQFVPVIERVLDAEPMLVLDLTEAVLDRVLEIDVNSSYVVSECLALSISLRIAHRGSASMLVDRIHALFERALAADAPAALDVLDTVDGRSGGLAYRPPFIPRRRIQRFRQRP